jgi:surface protein
MFANAISFNDPVDHWDVSNVGNLLRVFSGATDFNQPLDAWDVSNVNDMRSAFAGATSFNQPLNSWDVSNVTTFGNLFQNASSFNQPLDNWDVSGVSGIGSMFQGATSFNQPLDAWDVSNVVNSNRMFFGAIAFNQPLSSWNTASNTNMIRMFENSAFNHSLATWDITSVTTMDLMFRGTHLSPSNLDATLVSWAGQAVQNNVPLHVGAKTYTSAGATALATLRDTYNWTITEQYLLTYDAGDNATLEGQSIQQLNSGDTGTAVTVTPRSGYRFIAWSDGITTSTRTDTNITDNVTLTAQIESIPSPRRGTSAARQAQNLESIGKIEEAAALCRQFPNACPTTTASTTGSSTQVLISLVKPEYRAIMAALLQVFGW